MKKWFQSLFKPKKTAQEEFEEIAEEPPIESEQPIDLDFHADGTAKRVTLRNGTKIDV